MEDSSVEYLNSSVPDLASFPATQLGYFPLRGALTTGLVLEGGSIWGAKLDEAASLLGPGLVAGISHDWDTVLPLGTCKPGGYWSVRPGTAGHSTSGPIRRKEGPALPPGVVWQAKWGWWRGLWSDSVGVNKLRCIKFGMDFCLWVFFVWSYFVLFFRTW